MPRRPQTTKPKVLAPVGVWAIAYGTARVFTAAPTADDAGRWFRAWVADQRTRGKIDERPVHYVVTAVAPSDLDDLRQAGKLPRWAEGATVVATSTPVDQPSLDLSAVP